MAVKKGGAKVSRLNTLHELLAEMFIRDIEESIRDEIPMSSADKSVIVTFLKNNDISAAPDEEQLTELRETFQELTDERRRTAALNIINSAAEDADFTLPLN